MTRSSHDNTSRFDEAARAGWLYYIAGNTQDEIAKKLGVSRQSAQRLVSLAVSERLIKFRLDHPIAKCMDLAARIKDHFGLQFCEVVPSDPDAPDQIAGIAIAAGSEMQRWLEHKEPKVLALGTGRALRSTVGQLPTMNCPQHRIVSLAGNMMSDGSASPYNAVIRLAEKVHALHYPMPTPVLARTAEELAVLHAQEPVRNTLALCKQADVTFVGIGQITPTAPLLQDGFVRQDELSHLQDSGMVGEITSWAFDENGQVATTGLNERVSSAPLVPNGQSPVIGIAAGLTKAPAILGALRGKLINGLVTDEAAATFIAEELQ